MGVDDEAQRRRELEGVAYDAHSTPAERAAAQRELELLARAPAEAPVDEVAADDVAADDEPETESEGSATTPEPTTRGRRVAIAGVLVGVLALGAVGGVGLAVGLPGHSTAGAVATDGTTSGASSSDHFPAIDQSQPTFEATLDPAATSRLAAGDPSTTSESPPPGDLAMADALLARPATKADDYPFPSDGGENSFKKSTVRLLATSGTGVRIFGSNKLGDPGFCLLEATGAAASEEGIAGFQTCVTAADFLEKGISADNNGFSVSWKGGSIALTLTGSN